MNRRSLFGSGAWKQQLLMMATLGLSILLTGCGGGGGGGGTINPPGNGMLVVSSSNIPATGTGVQFLDAAGNPIGQPVNITFGANGSFSMVPPSNAIYFKLKDTSGGSGFAISDQIFYVNGVTHYPTYLLANDGSPCVPKLIASAQGPGLTLNNITVFSANPPPPPEQVCPR